MMEPDFLTSKMSSLVQCVVTVMTLTFTTVVISSHALMCPEKCSCSPNKEVASDLTVNCSHAGLLATPENLPPNTRELSLSNNRLKHMDFSTFKHLTQLQKLVLTHCHIKLVASSPDILGALQVLDLSHNFLDKIPESLPANLKTLILSHNSLLGVDYKSSLSHLSNLKDLFLDHNLISAITENSFRSEKHGTSSLQGLQKLALNGNRLKSLASKSFQGLDDLSALTLSHNSLANVNKDMFEGLYKLKHLDLSSNHISDMEHETFRSLQRLKYLKLNSNQLNHFPSGLPMLEWLDLSHNFIRTILESESKADIYPVEVLNLAHNPFNCDCQLLWLKELYDQREYLLKHIELEAKDFVPTCASPLAVAGESWDLLGDKVFNCDPDKSSSGGPTLSIQKDNIDLTTRVGKISDSSIQLIWTSTSPGFAARNIAIQYYVFGHRSTSTKHVQVAAAQGQYMLKNLKALTNYVICICTKLINSEAKGENIKSNFSLDDCIEVATRAAKPPPVASRLEIVFYYILGMLATFIGIFATIGGCAIIYGLWTHKSGQWSAGVRDESYQEDKTYDTDEPINQNNKPHTD